MFAWLRTRLSRWFASTTSAPASWFVEWIRGGEDEASGVKINGKSCLKYAPVWYAVRKISGHIAQLPLVLYERTGERSKRRATEHPAYRVVKSRPNPAMTASVFRELLQYHALIWGNGRAVIVRNNRGDVLELVPLMPDKTKTVVVNGTKWHVSEILVDQQTGLTETRKFRDQDVLHIMGMSYDGICGIPLYEIARGSWGLGYGAETQASRYYRNNAAPGLILEAPPGVFPDDEEARKFLLAFRDAHEGVENASKTALLREGIKASKLSNTPQEAQAVETRLFQRQDVALWFLLEQILGDNKSVSYNSLEQANLAYLINCLNTWLVKWQEQCEAKLLTEREQAEDTYYFRFSTGALLRSDFKTTVETLTSAIRGRLLTTNEARDVIDYDEIEGGDELSNPAITPGPPGQEPPPEEDDTEDEDEADAGGETEDETVTAIRQQLRRVVHARLTELCDVERARVGYLAGTNGRLDDWYQRWQATLAEALLAMTSDQALALGTAALWCAESREDLKRDGELTEILASWSGRIDALTDRILQGVDDVANRQERCAA